MGFKELNKNFIIHELNRAMRNLNSNEKLERYTLIQSETRKRLRESYSKSDNKEQFYIDVFEVLGEYECAYLITNLLLEKCWFELIKAVLPKISGWRKNFVYPLLLDKFFDVFEYSQCNTLRFEIARKLGYKKELAYIVCLFERHIDSNNDLIDEFLNPKSNEFVKTLAYYIANSKDSNDTRFWIFLLFNKIWEAYYYDGSLHRLRGAIFYRDLNENLNSENNLIRFTRFLKYVNSTLSECFVSLEYSSLQPNILDFESSKGLINYYRLLQNRVIEGNEMMKLTEESSFSDVLEYVEEKKAFNKRAIDILEMKISQIQYPNPTELRYFVKVYKQFENQCKEVKKIAKLLYLFELV